VNTPDNITIKNCNLDNFSVGVYVLASDVRMDNIAVTNSVYDGIDIDDSSNVNLSGLDIENSGDRNLRMYDTHDVVVNNLYCDGGNISFSCFIFGNSSNLSVENLTSTNVTNECFATWDGSHDIKMENEYCTESGVGFSNGLNSYNLEIRNLTTQNTLTGVSCWEANNYTIDGFIGTNFTRGADSSDGFSFNNCTDIDIKNADLTYAGFHGLRILVIATRQQR
jgi:hypothetical protein